MKRSKILFIIFALAVMLCTAGSLAACGSKEQPHEHAFTEQKTDETYLKSKASCTEAAVYYYSCVCGEKGTETFTSGNVLQHTYAAGVCVDCDDLQTKGLAYILADDGTYYTASGMGTCTDPDIYIANKYEGKPVKSIGYMAFADRVDLISIEIPNSVESIAGGAFEGCTGLMSIEIPGSVTSVGVRAFSGCSGLASITVASGNAKYHADGNCLIETQSKTIILGCKDSVIPTGEVVTSIGDSAFEGCSGLAYMEMPDGIENINSGAFKDCVGLTYIEIPNSVASISETAFYDCAKLADVYYIGNAGQWSAINIANENDSLTSAAIHYTYGLEYTLSDDETYYTVSGIGACIDTDIQILKKYRNLPTKSIGGSAFRGCTGLTSIEIPNSVKSIGRYAFYNCVGLTGIELLSGVESIGDYAFSWCGKLTSATIPGSVTSVGEQIFSMCSELTDVTISSGITRIGNRMFMSCGSLTSIDIPNSVTSIDDRAFLNCSGLKSIDIPNGVKSIDDGAFMHCIGLTSIEISDSVTNIVAMAFYGCTGLTSITVASGNAKYHSNGNCIIETQSGKLICGCKNSVIPTDGSVTSIGGSAFKGCTELTNIEIPSSVTNIVAMAFYGCTGLTSITVASGNTNYHSDGNCLIETHSKTLILGCQTSIIPIDGSVTSIGDYAFYNCSQLTSITIPNGVTSIGDHAFYGCSGLKSIELPSGAESIDSSAFEYCIELTSITIPTSVTFIGGFAFHCCNSLADVYYTGSEQEWTEIAVETENGKLMEANIHYNYDPNSQVA